MRRTLLSLFSALAVACALIAAPPASAKVDLTPVTITVAADRTTLDPEHPTATIKGRVTAQRPGEEPHPLAGRKVHLTGHSQAPHLPDALTDATGAFTATYAPGGYWESPVTAEVEAAGEYAAASAATENITIRQAQTRLTVKTDKPKADQGKPFTLSGLVEWKSSRDWRPLGGAAVALTIPNNCGAATQQVRAKSGPAGRYSATVVPRCTTGVSGSVSHPSGLYEGAEATMPGQLTVRPGVKIDFAVSLNPWGRVQVSGGIYPREPALSQSYTGQKILIEYSFDGRSHWRTHKTVRVRDNRFSAEFVVYYSGHWRARYAGGPNGMPGTSPVRKKWRWGTRMSKLKVSPTRVRRNRSVTASGTLTRYYTMQQRKPSAFPGQSVRIFWRPRGERTWYHLAWVKTDRRGRYKKKVPAYADGYYASEFYGTNDTWATGSPNTFYVDTYSSIASALIAAALVPVNLTPRPASPADTPSGSG